jgi:hypothetical protein
MKKFVLTAMMCIPMLAMAQSNWELPKSQQVEAPKKKEEAQKSVKNTQANEGNAGKTYTIKEEDRPYLKGAVPEIDGKVAYNFSVDMAGKSASEVYGAVYTQLEKFAKSENQTEASRIAIVNREEHRIIATFKEWLVFADKLLVLDRTKFNYIIIANCKDGKVDMSIERLTYDYETQREREFITAEELITDDKTLANDGTKLKKRNSKFRRKTVDRMNEVITYFKDSLK